MGLSAFPTPAALLLAALLATPALAEPPPDAGKQRLIDQKVNLVESLAQTAAARQAQNGQEGEGPGLAENSRKAVESARRLAGEGQYDEAARQLDLALKAITSASRRLASDGGLSDAERQKLYQEQQEQVATYRAAIADLTTQSKTANAAKALLTRLDAIRAEAERQAGQGRLGEANKKLAEAYKLAVSELSSLRAGQEVILSLKFDTPADEYKYEQKRFNSNQIMVNMMLGEGRAEGDKRKLVDGFIDAARQLQQAAEAEADRQRYKEAVTQMEQATTQLNRALQSMGIPVF